jgi:hypothetical protein
VGVENPLPDQALDFISTQVTAALFLVGIIAGICFWGGELEGAVEEIVEGYQGVDKYSDAVVFENRVATPRKRSSLVV